MSTREPARGLSFLGRLKQGFRQWKRGPMPDCACGASNLAAPVDRRTQCATAGRGPTGQAGPVEHIEPDPERLTRVAIYALGGYFHSGCLGDMFVSTPDIWIERVEEHGR
ncbi:hypothetical protein [Pararobbsia alpina]|uniref:Uncharacterized protein n=1 Tax=Pararobbsia alpina TaxID=621374 RepID=A0A6S7BHS3_9BURK|nr:hypothetical protein [Pararobbsia alpina]CAB3799973.1 hypothetical protein LMG28138_04774 [Pararobbsia alpina]